MPSEPPAEQLQEAMEAFVVEDFDEALGLYDALIAAYPTHAVSFVHRSATYLKLDQPLDALADANRAIALAPDNPKAYLRKGMSCFALEEFAPAKAAFEAGAKLDPSSSQFRTWIRKCDAELAEEEGAGVDVDMPPASASTGTPAATPTQAPTPALAPLSAASTPVAPRYKHQWYQSMSHITAEVLAPGINPDDITFNITEQHLKVAIRASDGGDDYLLDVPLFGRVDVADCRTSVGRAKIEIRLKKSAAVQWQDLKGSGAARSALQPANNAFSDPAMARPTYPSSKAAQKKSNMDWDKLEKELKDEEEDEKLEGDAALNKLFRDIYGKADEETRRAMNKSFQESNGTVLSTNWSEIGSKFTEGQAPQGMEAKKYEQ